MTDYFIKDYGGILRIALSAGILYVCVIIFIRIVGKRATSQMNNFDWIVTVAIGSIVASTIVLQDLPLLEGLAAIAILLLLQYIVTKLSIMWPLFSKLIHAEPVILFYQGNYLRSAMANERVTEQEILSAIRQAGMHRLDDVGAVVLETDAKLSVLSTTDTTTAQQSTLHGIKNYQDITKHN